MTAKKLAIALAGREADEEFFWARSGMPKPAMDRYLARVRKETKSNN